jgi:hypothetical protein
VLVGHWLMSLRWRIGLLWVKQLLLLLLRLLLLQL